MHNAVVAELGIHKLNDQRGRIDSLLLVTENRCVLFDLSTHVYMYVYILTHTDTYIHINTRTYM